MYAQREHAFMWNSWGKVPSQQWSGLLTIVMVSPCQLWRTPANTASYTRRQTPPVSLEPLYVWESGIGWGLGSWQRSRERASVRKKAIRQQTQHSEPNATALLKEKPSAEVTITALTLYCGNAFIRVHLEARGVHFLCLNPRVRFIRNITKDAFAEQLATDCREPKRKCNRKAISAWLNSLYRWLWCWEGVSRLLSLSAWCPSASSQRPRQITEVHGAA